jgi:hypothetical protein
MGLLSSTADLAERALRAGAKRLACGATGLLNRFDPREAVVLSSSPRGGSTWITEQLCEAFAPAAVLWEPLNLDHVPRFRRLGFAWRQHIPEDADWPKAEKAFDRVLTGREINKWTCFLSRPAAFWKAERILVKFVRANALLPWLTRRYDFRRKPIHLIRHPMAVVASQLKNNCWKGRPDRYEIPECRYREFYTDHADFLGSLNSKTECLAAQWCLTNKVALEHQRAGQDWMTVCYEDLLLEPEKTLNEIFTAWGLDRDGRAAAGIRQPSRTTQDEKYLSDPQKQLSKWRRELSDEQVERSLAVLDHFGIGLYGPGLRPVKDA